MREFSDYEKKIILTKLIDGSGLANMLDFNSKGQLLVAINIAGQLGIHKFTFKSTTYDSQIAVNELVDLFDLLKYLLEEGYVRKYPDAATTERETEFSPVISLGEQNNGQAKTFLLNVNARELGDFLR